MSIIKSQKLGRRFGVPLIVFWVLFQSMLFCAALLNIVILPVAPLGIANESVMQGMSGGTTAGIDSHSEHSKLAQHHAMDHSATDITQDNCCEKQDNYLTNFSYSFVVPLLLAFVLFLVLNIPSSKSKWFSYLKEPPPRFNYPRNHLVNCTFLD